MSVGVGRVRVSIFLLLFQSPAVSRSGNKFSSAERTSSSVSALCTAAMTPMASSTSADRDDACLSRMGCFILEFPDLELGD